MIGLTLDTGALIALERRRQRIWAALRLVHASRGTVTVPAAVLAEWWRSGTDVRERILKALHVEPMGESLAKRAGEACAAVRGATMVDAVVMASAATRGDVVYTSDFDDLEALRNHFPAVRVFRI